MAIVQDSTSFHMPCAPHHSFMLIDSWLPWLRRSAASKLRAHTCPTCRSCHSRVAPPQPAHCQQPLRVPNHGQDLHTTLRNASSEACSRLFRTARAGPYSHQLDQRPLRVTKCSRLCFTIETSPEFPMLLPRPTGAACKKSSIYIKQAQSHQLELVLDPLLPTSINFQPPEWTHNDSYFVDLCKS